MLIDDLPALETFARIVSAGSLSAAARELDLSLSVVSKRLAHLESRLGVRLLHRTTRQQTLTDDGAQFHAQVLRILAEIERAETLMSDRRGTVNGMLRVTAPGELGRVRIVPLVAAFQRQHPALTVQLMLTDTIVDLLAQDIDVAVRIGSLADSTMIARELAPNHRVLCAAPSYVATHGLPAHPADLRAHRCIVLGDQPRTEWRFDGANGSVAVDVTAALLTNDGGAARSFALEGAGIALKSIWDVDADLDAGTLVRVLPAFAAPAAPLHAVYPGGRHVPLRVRAFVEFLREQLRDAWQRGA
ncbi:LysR family transcriptional regulator [Burkholderia sp. SIMBA_043]|uniref:LysR family transcriptional regulator n=1 Tax=Burkholderia TaxID=32008 RepID=UPI0005D91F4C|nr:MULTISPECIES: LysR family transcriptional regulator [Burkholderia]AJY07416.1 bacterial regulatory helix-turn-helix, lysR family protein [Burkholderia vietnamiensis LMG 10929]AOK00058.1 LysR family transcriptional regulator [Burkholderia vietnamiensis]AVR17599.1 LysR family transcriptional regulator [Burkholderia vietnamiensis]KVF05596.1 LysR family transcriptional regulator [Burkholderia vietnamiensis]KVM50578.1 LysR family transcriptional regulator [Burkholderia vietnamiensis]